MTTNINDKYFIVHMYHHCDDTLKFDFYEHNTEVDAINDILNRLNIDAEIQSSTIIELVDAIYINKTLINDCVIQSRKCAIMALKKQYFIRTTTCESCSSFDAYMVKHLDNEKISDQGLNNWKENIIQDNKSWYRQWNCGLDKSKYPFGHMDLKQIWKKYSPKLNISQTGIRTLSIKIIERLKEFRELLNIHADELINDSYDQKISYIAYGKKSINKIDIEHINKNINRAIELFRASDFRSLNDEFLIEYGFESSIYGTDIDFIVFRKIEYYKYEELDHILYLLSHSSNKLLAFCKLYPFLLLGDQIIKH